MYAAFCSLKFLRYFIGEMLIIDLKHLSTSLLLTFATIAKSSKVMFFE